MGIHGHLQELKTQILIAYKIVERASTTTSRHGRLHVTYSPESLPRNHEGISSEAHLGTFLIQQKLVSVTQGAGDREIQDWESAFGLHFVLCCHGLASEQMLNRARGRGGTRFI